MKLPNDQIIHFESKDGISIDIIRTELVRCSECEYQHSHGDGTGWCDRAIINGDELSCVAANDNDYCSYGERKEQEE